MNKTRRLTHGPVQTRYQALCLPQQTPSIANALARLTNPAPPGDRETPPQNTFFLKPQKHARAAAPVPRRSGDPPAAPGDRETPPKHFIFKNYGTAASRADPGRHQKCRLGGKGPKRTQEGFLENQNNSLRNT